METWSKTSGARISTYVILGERGSRCCILNGAAARTCQPTPSIWTKRAFLSEAADRYVRHQQCRWLLADGNALKRTALTTTSAGALQQNFRRSMEQQELVEETGESAFDTGGRPAKLYRFRHHVLDETAVARTKLPLARA